MRTNEEREAKSRLRRSLKLSSEDNVHDVGSGGGGGSGCDAGGDGPWREPRRDDAGPNERLVLWVRGGLRILGSREAGSVWPGCCEKCPLGFVLSMPVVCGLSFLTGLD